MSESSDWVVTAQLSTRSDKNEALRSSMSMEKPVRSRSGAINAQDGLNSGILNVKTHT